MLRKTRLLTIVIALILMAGALLLAACQPSDDPEVDTGEEDATVVVSEETDGEGEGEEQAATDAACEEEVILNYWDEFGSPEDAAIWDPIFEEFNQQHEGCIEARVRHIADEEFFTALRIGVTGSSPPDVFQHESGLQLKELVDAGAVMPITDWWEENQERWQPGSNEANIHDGEVYAVPIEALLRDLLAWNVDILEEHDLEPPETWDDFLAACDVLNEAGVVPLAIGNQRGWPGGHLWQTIALRVAGDEKQNLAMQRDGVHWTDPDFIRASELYVELAERECLSPGFSTDDFGEGMAFFLGGNAAFFHPFTLHMATWPSRDELNWDWGRFPQISDEQQPYAEDWDMFAVNLYGLSISAQTDHPEEAMTLFEYLVSVPVQRQFVQNSRLTPMTDVLEPGQISEDLATFQEMQSQATGQIGFIVLEVPPEVSRQVFDVGALAVWTGQQTVQEWMENMEEAHAGITDTEAVLDPERYIPEDSE